MTGLVEARLPTRYGVVEVQRPGMKPVVAQGGDVVFMTRKQAVALGAELLETAQSEPVTPMPDASPAPRAKARGKRDSGE